MLSVLIEGSLIAAPVQRTSAKGSTFITAQMRCNAEDGESLFVSVIAFSASATEALAQLTAGDTVAIAGPAAISRWEKNGEQHVGLKVTATRVLTVYDAGMRRKAASARHGQGQDHGPGDTGLARQHAPSMRVWADRMNVMSGITKRRSGGIRYSGLRLTAEEATRLASVAGGWTR